MTVFFFFFALLPVLGYTTIGVMKTVENWVSQEARGIVMDEVDDETDVGPAVLIRHDHDVPVTELGGVRVRAPDVKAHYLHDVLNRSFS